MGPARTRIGPVPFAGAPGGRCPCRLLSHVRRDLQRRLAFGCRDGTAVAGGRLGTRRRPRNHGGPVTSPFPRLREVWRSPLRRGSLPVLPRGLCRRRPGRGRSPGSRGPSPTGGSHASLRHRLHRGGHDGSRGLPLLWAHRPRGHGRRTRRRSRPVDGRAQDVAFLFGTDSRKTTKMPATRGLSASRGIESQPTRRR